MDTFSLVRPAHHVRIRLSTAEPTEFVDLTARLADVVHESGVQTGLLNVQTTHTTTAIVVNEHEPLLQQDLHAALARLAPLSLVYRHDDLTRRHGVPPDEPRNGHAHCRAFFLPTAVSLNIIDGRLSLGRWQRVFLVELDGPRTREVTAVAIGAAR